MAFRCGGGSFQKLDKAEKAVNNFSDNMQNDPFKATQLWYKLIAYLRSHVHLRKKRFMIRQYHDCFTGENAADVVYNCLQNEQKNCSLLTNKITRTNAIKVCQVLIESNIFEDVGKKSIDEFGKSVFEDSRAKFYQFSLHGKQMEIYSPRDEAKLASPPNKKINEKLRSISLNNGIHIPPPDDDMKLNKRRRSLDLGKRSTNFFDRMTPIPASPDGARDCLSPFQRLRSLSISGSSSSSSSNHSIGSKKSSDNGQCLEKCSARSNDEEANFRPSFRTSIRRRLLDFHSHVSGVGGGYGSHQLAAEMSFAKLMAELQDDGTSPISGSPCISRTFKVSSSKDGQPNLLRFNKRLSSSGSNLSQVSTNDEEVRTNSVDEDEVWKQVALSRLLTLVDICFLDELLPYLHESKPACTAPTVPLVCHSPEPSDNAWVRMAEEITESRCFFLDNPIGLTEGELKMQAFRKVRRYYHSLPQLPIIASHLNKIFIAILGLVRSAKFSVAVHTLQLAVILLPWQQRKELRLLLRFMRMVSDDEGQLRLKPQISNMYLMLQQFVPMIIRYELLAPDQASLLVSFMLQHQEIIFVPPPDIKTEVESIVLESKLDRSPSIKAVNYCHQIPSKVYEAQINSVTQRALNDLMDSVLDSTTLSLKDKEQWLKKFKKSHPDNYHKWYHGEI